MYTACNNHVGTNNSVLVAYYGNETCTITKILLYFELSI